MGIFTEALHEVKSSLLKVFIFEEALNAILAFLALYLLLSLFKMGTFRLLIPIVIALGYLCIAAYKKTKIRTAKTVETKYKDLQEKLSTASEYATVDNPVANELKSEVMKGLRKVEESSFLDEKKVYIKSVMAIALCFAILLTSPVSVGFFKASFPNLFSGGGNGQAGGLNGKFQLINNNAKNTVPVNVQATKGDIYGSPTVAKLGSEELKVTIKPAGTELSSTNSKPPEELQFTEQYPEEAVAVAAESMEEQIPKEQQELVRQYFKAVVEGQG